MKKILLLGIVATLFTLGASAQNRKEYSKDKKGPDRQHMSVRQHQRMDHRTHNLTGGERSKMRHNAAGYQRAKHRAYRDGKVTHREQRNLYKMKKHNRHDAYRFMHNDRKRGR
ncbi:MAG: hypothetical protein EOO05_02660 [Chitinophagaceae bacterium]|nr:MAG: hypothetical protein EOO05_02660 [Chitinophagaceae bacterium]